MQKAITLSYQGLTLRGMEHVPERAEGSEKLPAVILYHGFTGDKLEPHRFFLKMSRAIEQCGIAAFRFDFLGSGESDGDFEEMTVSKEIAEAKAILEMVKNDPRIDQARISLLGLSMGGLVAGVVAGEQPADIDRLVLMAPAGEMYPFIEKTLGDELHNPELVTYDLGGDLVGRAFAEDCKTLNVFTRSQGFRGDVLLVHGTNDPVVPVMVSHLYQQHSFGGRATLHEIEGADHTFNKYEWEREAIETVCQFLTK
jgi:uncharacterized protein